MFPDPLLAGCWRCGSDEIAPDDDGRDLCTPCRRFLRGHTPVPIVPRAGGNLGWQQAALVKCWRCLSDGIAPSDELGLCDPCKAQLVGKTETT